MYYNQPICLQTHVLLAPWFTSWTTALRTLMLKDFVWSRCVMFLLWLIFLMVSRKQDNKKRENISNPVAFSIFENSHYFWILFGATMNLNPCTVQGCALVWQTSVQLQSHTENQWLQLEMSIHLAHSFIFSPAWTQHHKCLKGTLISSEGFISKQLLQNNGWEGAFQINFRWTKLSEYRRSTSYW